MLTGSKPGVPGGEGGGRRRGLCAQGETGRRSQRQSPGLGLFVRGGESGRSSRAAGVRGVRRGGGDVSRRGLAEDGRSSEEVEYG